MSRAGAGSGAARLAAVAGLLWLGGCYVTQRYQVTPEQLAQVAQIPAAEAKTTVLPVQRYKVAARGGAPIIKPVLVRADALQQAQPEAGGPPGIVRSRRYSPVVTAGAVITTIGSVVSIASTIVFFASFGSSGDLHLNSGLVELSTEPVMILGTVLWMVGLQRPPQEVPAGRVDLRYLDAAPALPAATPPLAPALSLRF